MPQKASPLPLKNYQHTAPEPLPRKYLSPRANKRPWPDHSNDEQQNAEQQKLAERRRRKKLPPRTHPPTHFRSPREKSTLPPFSSSSVLSVSRATGARLPSRKPSSTPVEGGCAVSSSLPLRRVSRARITVDNGAARGERRSPCVGEERGVVKMKPSNRGSRIVFATLFYARGRRFPRSSSA